MSINFLSINDGQIAIAQIPRAGINSMRKKMMGRYRFVNAEEAMGHSRRVAFIRHPIDRLKSAYALMIGLRDQGHDNFGRSGIDGWADFVDYALSPVDDDIHWVPQHDLVGDVPNEWHRIENIVAEFSSIDGGEFPHENHWPRPDGIFEYRTSELTQKYRKDLEIWRSI